MSKPPVGLSSSSSSSISTSQLVADLRRDDDHIKKLDEAIFASSTNRIDDDDILDPTALDSDSTDTSLNILKRNYDIIRQKSAENNTNNLSVPPQNINHQRSVEPETGELDDSANNSFVSTRSMNNITNQQQQPKLNRSLPVVKPTTRIKIVKKQKAAQQQQQQQQSQQQVQQQSGIGVGIGLRRAPDIIETIETKTSMSFIMNKSVNLVVEEKREPPPLPPRHSSIRTESGLTSAISQPQLYQTRIDDLLNTANDLIKSNTNSPRSNPNENETVYRSKFRIQSASGAFRKVAGAGDETSTSCRVPSTPIPITVQSRSKSEPKLDLEFDFSATSSPKISYRVIY